MEENLNDYLVKNYTLTLEDIVHIHFGGYIYGESLANQLSLIFSIDPLTSEKAVKKWIVENITTEHGVVDDYWLKKNTLRYYEPKRSNRFLIRFPVEFEVPQYLIKSTSRPSVQFINGLVEWNDIEISLNDPIGPSMAERMHELFLRIGSQYTNQAFQYYLEMLDPTGVVIEQWVITGYLINLDFGNLDYLLEESVEIKMTIKPTNVVLTY